MCSDWRVGLVIGGLSVRCEFEPHLGPICVLEDRNLTLIALYWLFQETDLILI